MQHLCGNGTELPDGIACFDALCNAGADPCGRDRRSSPPLFGLADVFAEPREADLLQPQATSQLIAYHKALMGAYVDQGGDLFSRDANEWTVLHHLAVVLAPSSLDDESEADTELRSLRAWQKELITHIASEVPELVNARDAAGKTAASWASEIGSQEIARLLEQLGRQQP